MGNDMGVLKNVAKVIVVREPELFTHLPWITVILIKNKGTCLGTVIPIVLKQKVRNREDGNDGRVAPSLFKEPQVLFKDSNQID